MTNLPCYHLRLANESRACIQPTHLLNAVGGPEPTAAACLIANHLIVLPGVHGCIRTRMEQVKTNCLMANLAKLHSSMLQSLSELTIKTAVGHPFIKAVYLQRIRSPD